MQRRPTTYFALVDDDGTLLAKRHITDDAAGYRLVLDVLAEYLLTARDRPCGYTIWNVAAAGARPRRTATGPEASRLAAHEKNRSPAGITSGLPVRRVTTSGRRSAPDQGR